PPGHTHQELEPDRRHVERARQGARRGDPAVIPMLVVARSPQAEGRREGVGHVIEERRGGERRPSSRERRVERGDVDERLEGRAGLPVRFHRPVEGALAIVPPADHGADRPVLRLDREKGGLRRVPVGAADLRARVRIAGSLAHATLGRFLEPGIERREHEQPAGAQVRFRDILREDLPNVIDEVGSARRRRRIGREPELRFSRPLRFGPRDESTRHHVFEHLVPSRDREVRVAVRRKPVRRRNDSGQERPLAERQLGRVLVEVVESALLEAADAPGPALPEIDLVEIELEDLFLGVAELNHHGEKRFVQLAGEGALPRKKDVFRELLADRAPALDDRPGGYVARRGASDSQEVESHVAEEAPVLARDRGERDVAWDRGERQVRATLTLRVREFGEELGIDAQEPARRRFREAVSDRSDVSVADLDEGGRAGLGTVRVEKGPKVDLEDGPAYAVLPRRVRSPARAAVARPIERLAELRDLERHSGAQLDPIRVYPRRKFPALSGITEGSERGEPEPVVPEKTEDEEEHDQRPPQPA